MSEKNIVLIPGDGIGTEIIAAAKAVCDVAFEKANVKVNWIDKKAGGASIDAYGVPLTEDTIEACKAADAVLLGAVGGPKWDNVDPAIRPEKAILGLRKELGLFCNLRPVKIYPSLQEYSPLKKELVQDVDFVIVRELTGGIYFGEREEAQGEGANEFAWDKETYSRYEVERIMDVAVETARKRSGKVVSVDKANVLASSRLWRKIAKEKAGIIKPLVPLVFDDQCPAASKVIEKTASSYGIQTFALTEKKTSTDHSFVHSFVHQHLEIFAL